jgi:hypothetical protein
MAKTKPKRIQTIKKLHLSSLLFTEEQVIIADTEGNLQKAAHKLNNL